jgi:hypothetical protein
VKPRGGKGGPARTTAVLGGRNRKVDRVKRNGNVNDGGDHTAEEGGELAAEEGGRSTRSDALFCGMALEMQRVLNVWWPGTK